MTDTHYQCRRLLVIRRQYVPEQLLPILNELAATYEKFRKDPEFIREFQYYLAKYSGRPTPLYLCSNLTKELGGAKIYLKREDLNHLGAHKVNNTIGQICWQNAWVRKNHR